MKIQNTPNLQLNNKNQKSNQVQAQPTFKGLVDVFFNYLQTNQGVGATFVDAAFMCTPRTIVDFSRGPAAGVETARREFSSNINDALLGAYGLVAAWAISQGFNRKYDVKADKIRVSKDRLDTLSEILYKNGTLNKPENLDKYLDEALNSTKGLNPATNEWVGIDEVKNDVITKIKEELLAPALNNKNDAKLRYNNNKDHIKSLLARATGAEGDFKIGESKSSSVSDYVDDLLKVTKAFMSEKVAKFFGTEVITDPKAIEEAIKENKFLKEFKNLKLSTAGLGIAACAVVGASVQPINMYLTKKKTGTTGFVGGGDQDKSTKFKVIKAAVASAAAYVMFRTIGEFKKIPTEIQFKGIWPTIPQFKFVYAITIISRLLSARNKNELRESSIKDSLGFANWLILGGFASKLTAMGLEKVVKFKKGSMVDNNFLKYNAKDNKFEKGLFNGKHRPKWLGGSVVSREEVLYQAFKKAGLSTIDESTKLAKPFKQLLNEAADIPGVKKKIALLALVQIAGYTWSALALGVGIPKLNIAITRAAENKKKQQMV